MNFWDKVAGIYDITQAINGKVQREMARMTAELIPEGARVLDTAAGTGVLTLAASPKAAEVVCTDLSLNMLDKAKAKAKAMSADNIRFEARNIFDLADEDESYDIVMAGNVLHLLNDPEKAVKELARVTKKGGLLILPTYMLGKKNDLIQLYKTVGFDPATNYSPKKYRSMLEGCNVGQIKAKLIKGIIPCCFAVIKRT